MFWSSIVVVIYFACVYAENCHLRYAEFSAKEPIFLWRSVKGYSLITPENDGIILDADEEIVIACPGATNKISDILVSENPARATCYKGTTLKVGSKEKRKHSLEISCNNQVTGSFERTTISCGHGGRIIHIGHMIKNRFLTLFNVCYNDVEEQALYVDHFIYGSAIRYSGKASGRPGFKVGGLASLRNPDQYYRKSSQKETFARILGSTSLANKYITDNTFLAKGHLAPDRDQVFASSQQSTYFYINAVPQWNQINSGNWVSLEISLRKIAETTKDDFQVYTGVHDILALENSNGQLVGMYLANNKLPVPKFIWKVFYSLKTKKGIAFVSLNNPFISATMNEHYLCEDICDAYGWGKPSWKDRSKGIMYCCEVSDLRKAVPNVPPLTVSGVQSKYIGSSLESLMPGNLDYDDDVNDDFEKGYVENDKGEEIDAKYDDKSDDAENEDVETEYDISRSL